MFCCVLNLYGFKSFINLLVSFYLGKKYLVWKFPIWNSEGTLTVVTVHVFNMWLCTYHGKHIISHENSSIPPDPLEYPEWSLCFSQGQRLFLDISGNIIGYCLWKLKILTILHKSFFGIRIHHNPNCWCALSLQGSKARGPLDSAGAVDLDSSVSRSLSGTRKVSKVWGECIYLETSDNMPWNN